MYSVELYRSTRAVLNILNRTRLNNTGKARNDHMRHNWLKLRVGKIYVCTNTRRMQRYVGKGQVRAE